MDELNMFHIFRDEVKEIDHGVQLVTQDNVDSKTLVCYLDAQCVLNYGFCYKNGSNLRVVVWEKEKNARKRRTPTKGSYIIAFTSVKTVRGVNDIFSEKDFNFKWFGEAKQELVKKELESLIDKQEKIEELVDKLCGLTIQELDKVMGTVNEIKN